MLNMLFPLEDVHTKQISVNGLEKWQTSLTDPRDALGTCTPFSQISFILIQFFAKIWPNNRLRPHLWGGPSSGKYGVRHWVTFSYLFFFNKFSCAYLYGETPGVVQFIQDYRSSSTVFFRCSLNDLVTFQLKVIAVGRVVPPAPLQIKSK